MEFPTLYYYVYRDAKEVDVTFIGKGRFKRIIRIK